MTTKLQFSGALAVAVALTLGLTVSGANESHVDANDKFTDRPAMNREKSAASRGEIPYEETQYAYEFEYQFENKLEDDYLGNDDPRALISHRIRTLQRLMTNRVTNTTGFDDRSFQPFSNPVSFDANEMQVLLGDYDDRFAIGVSTHGNAQLQLRSALLAIDF